MCFRGAALGVVGLLVVGCARDSVRGALGGDGVTRAQPEPVSTLPGRMGGGVAAATQEGAFPLGPSVTQVGPEMRTGTRGLSLNGTLPSRLVRSGAPQEEPAVQVRPPMGGNVASIPNVPDRSGSGLSAHNGQGARRWGSAYVPRRDFTVPKTHAGAGGMGRGRSAGAGRSSPPLPSPQVP